MTIDTAEDGDVPSPTIGKVKDSIKRLKNNKSADKDGIGAELIKMGPDKLPDFLHRLIWDTDQLPEELKDGVICPQICPIYKKGDKLDCENYRAITALNAAYKVLSQVIFQPPLQKLCGLCQIGRGFCRLFSSFSSSKNLCRPPCFQRLSPLTNEFVESYQAGFVEGRSKTNQIISLQQILQKCRE